ncbi:hypothetical protein [Streptomyces mirabilis]
MINFFVPRQIVLDIERRAPRRGRRSETRHS